MSSPTASTESVLLTSVVEALEEQHVATADVLNAFVQAELKPKPSEPRTVLVLRGIPVDMLLAMDSQLCEKFIKQ